ncbi:coiled-coil domain-containing protein 177-like [Physella acuta]|uniref:coiled-coil domain-containing protein 177-like n=1 Tax=Physella acuta TaxID=109671 RepID=UPI0027DC32B3|nr:coiled-coil domain-containing protein 177-like [Physella acuta]
METELSVKIDLYNLDDAKFENSKYVLTSPRSLEACSRLNVKPIELLYKPLSEFHEEFLPQDVPQHTIYALYDESEQIRQKKLKLCREERSRLILENQKKSRLLVEAKMFPTHGFPSHALRRNNSSNLALNSTKGRKRSFERESPKLHRELISKKDLLPQKHHSARRSRPVSAEGRKPQRRSTSAVVGSRVEYRSGSAPCHVRLPARDEKILKLMTERREKERKNLSVSREAHRVWEEQKRREEILKLLAENKRRQLLDEENRLNYLYKTDGPEKLEDDNKNRLKVDIDQHSSDASLMRQLRLQEQKLEDRIRKETLKKTSQERNLQRISDSDKYLAKLLLKDQTSDLNSASERKGVRIHHESLKKFLENRKAREEFERRKKSLTNQEKENEDLIRSSMEVRLGQAEAKLYQVLDKRNRQLEEQHHQEQVKLQKARSSNKQKDAAIQEYLQELLEHKKQVELRAQATAQRSIEHKSHQARVQRTQKQQEHRRNMSKIQKEKDRQRKLLEISLSQKDRKIEELLEEKERTVAETRALAQLSQTLRDDIKDKYESDTFDKKVLEAQLYANLEKPVRQKSWTKAGH